MQQELRPRVYVDILLVRSASSFFIFTQTALILLSEHLPHHVENKFKTDRQSHIEYHRVYKNLPRRFIPVHGYVRLPSVENFPEQRTLLLHVCVRKNY